MTGETSTRERILTAARSLFAQRGYVGTSVGDIEAAAGLSPRSGALYKHFSSKEELLRAVMERHGAAVASRLELPPMGDLRAEIALIGRFALAELRREHELTRIVMKEGQRFPEVARAFHEGIVLRAHSEAASWVSRVAQREGFSLVDPQAVAAVFVNSLVGYTIEELLFGPSELDDERFLAAWVDSTLAVMRSLIDERSPAHA
jgi:AcrR family transcriptional regulator